MPSRVTGRSRWPKAVTIRSLSSVVMTRETAQMTAGFLGAPARDRAVRVKFIYKDFETEMSGSAQGGTLGSRGAWSKAANKVLKQVEEWVTANRSKLPVDGRGRPD